VKFIFKRKFKFYTKEILKLFNITLIAFGFIIAIVLIKYKPIYEVIISGENVGYVESKDIFQQNIENYTKNYRAKNVDSIEIKENPEYKLKLVEKSQETNENEVVIALQKDMEITYKYYNILLNGEKIESVDTLTDAEQIVSEIESDEVTIEEMKTENIEEIETNKLQVAKNNVLEAIGKLDKSSNTSGNRKYNIKIWCK
jgi:hypothetical protein